MRKGRCGSIRKPCNSRSGNGKRLPVGMHRVEAVGHHLQPRDCAIIPAIGKHGCSECTAGGGIHLGWEGAWTSASALGAAIFIATRSRFGISERASNPATGPPCKCNGNRRSTSLGQMHRCWSELCFHGPHCALEKVDSPAGTNSRPWRPSIFPDARFTLSWGVLIARENMGSCVPRFQLWVGAERNIASPANLTERMMQSSAQRCHLRAVIEACDDRR